MLSTILGVFIGGWLLCSFIAVAGVFSQEIRDLSTAKKYGIGFKITCAVCFFILGPLLIGVSISDIVYNTKSKRPC